MAILIALDCLHCTLRHNVCVRDEQYPTMGAHYQFMYPTEMKSAAALLLVQAGDILDDEPCPDESLHGIKIR